MRHGALFNGIGGFQLAAHWMGWENVFHCEIDKFCNQVVKRHFPESICYEDIKQTDFTPWRGAIGTLTGGFPCQPYSSAGKRLGKEDERHLWPEMLRAVREIRPTWIVGENVRGLTNWNGGMVFDEVQADLETENYEVLPFLLPAAGVNAPHQRQRIWFVAQSGRKFGDWREGNETGKLHNYWEDNGRPEKANKSQRLFKEGNASDAECRRSQQRPNFDRMGRHQESYEKNSWNEFPTQSPFCGRNDGISSRLDRTKSLGNAIVPQVALEIFKAIQSYEQLIPTQQSIKKGQENDR